MAINYEFSISEDKAINDAYKRGIKDLAEVIEKILVWRNKGVSINLLVPVIADAVEVIKNVEYDLEYCKHLIPIKDYCLPCGRIHNV